MNKVIQDWKNENDAKHFQRVEKFLYQISLHKRNENKISDRWNEEVFVEKQKHSIYLQYHALCDKKQNYLGCYFILEDKTEENRKHDEEIQRHPNGKRYLLVSNVKDFKLINNIYGKDYGDELIRMQAKLIKQYMEEDTFCGRIYGDKFAMLICRDSYRSEIFQNAVKALQRFTMQKKYKIFYHIGIYDEKNEFSTISRLREYGFKVEIDDFGSGYSSFNMLKDIGVDVLKIDRIFLNETQNHAKSKMILHAIVTLAKEMKIGIVTEGVEKQSQVDMLTELGCNIFQGYYFDKPLPVEQFEEKYFKSIITKLERE